MIKGLGQLGMTAGFAAVCLVGAFAMSAQAQNSGYSSPHVDTSGVNMQPAYPSTALANSEQGTVAVEVVVDEHGKASHPKLAKSSGFDDLDNAAISAVLNWKFIPAMRGGAPESDRLTVAVNFQLPNNVPASSPQAPH